VSATKRAIQEDHVDALATSLNSSVVLAEKEVSRNTILHMVAAPQHPNVTQEGHKWLFRLNETNATRAKRFGKFICERMGLKSLSLITINDDYGRAEVAAYQPTFESCGMKVVGNEFFERTDTDFTVQLTKIKSQRADAVYVIASSTSQGATIYRQLKQLGYPGKIIAAGGNMNPKLVELSGPALEGVYSVVMYTDAMDNPQSKEFVRVYRTLFKEPISHVGGLTAECIEIAVEAMEKAGSSTDYDKISTIIRSTTWHTIRGTVTFDDIGQALANNIIVQVKGGAIVPVNY
jgi:branched-chain amino acid transport system substrate-binding protein